MPGPAELKTQYSIAELSRMSGLSTTQLRRFLKRKKVLLERGGGRNYIVYLSMLTHYAADFWKSILQREQLGRQPVRLEPDED